MRLENNKVELLVDECWTSKEVIMLCGAMSVFRLNLRHITLDAPIIELVSFHIYGTMGRTRFLAHIPLQNLTFGFYALFSGVFLPNTHIVWAERNVVFGRFD
jgi:hypothetical protein